MTITAHHKNQKRLYFSLGGVLLGILLFASCSTAVNFRKMDTLQPDPKLSPDEVVHIQMEALKNNDDQNQGIEIAFRFASPKNKQVTGPLPRFIAMINGPLYRPMLSYRSVSYGQLVRVDARARQSVTVTALNGVEITYVFFLSRQQGGEYPDCWMTDSVIIASVREKLIAMLITKPLKRS